MQREEVALGIQVNPLKTQLLCISAGGESVNETFIEPADGSEKIRSGDELKILDFRFGTRPNVNSHIVL